MVLSERGVAVKCEAQGVSDMLFQGYCTAGYINMLKSPIVLQTFYTIKVGTVGPRLSESQLYQQYK